MPIERKLKTQIRKRQESELVEKHRRIGELLNMEPVPVHTLAWKEQRLSLETADCYPIVDVLERMSELLNELLRGHPILEKSGRKQKPKKGK